MTGAPWTPNLSPDGICRNWVNNIRWEFPCRCPVKVKSHWTNEISVWFMALHPLVSLCLILVCVGDGVWVGRRCAERTYKDMKSRWLNARKLCLSGDVSSASFFGRTPGVISVSDTVEKAGYWKDSHESPPPSYTLDRLNSRICFGLNIGHDYVSWPKKWAEEWKGELSVNCLPPSSRLEGWTLASWWHAAQLRCVCFPFVWDISLL